MKAKYFFILLVVLGCPLLLILGSYLGNPIGYNYKQKIHQANQDEMLRMRGDRLRQEYGL